MKTWMKALALCGALAGSKAWAVAVGDTFPAVSVKHVKDGALDNAGMQGKITIVNFWATWCAACKVELLEMEDLFRPLASEKDVQMAFVSLDKEPEKATEWFQSNLKEPDQMLKHLFMDPAFEAADKLSADSFPMTFVIGRDGKVAFVQKGFKEGEGSTEKIAKLVAELAHK
jgi:thiol-disulfide isomerase/thioredoxin